MSERTYDFKRHIALEASAGTGKTYTLTLRLINLLLSGVSLDKIVALTFTNKAAQEMKQRLIKLLRDYIFKGDEKTGIEEVIKALSDRGEKESRNLVFSVYQLLLDNMSSLEIGTLDSFFSSIIRIFPFELGLRPDVEIADEGREKAIFDEAMTKFSTEIERDERLRGLILKFYQLGIIKTTLNIKHWLLPYLEKFWQFHQDVINSSQYKTASEEIFHFPKVDKLLPYLKDGYKKPDDIFKIKEKEALPLLEEYLEERNRWAVAVLLHFYRGFLRHFEGIKKRENLITFLDLSWLTYRLLADKGVFERDRDFFYYRLDKRIKHLLLDEFQDTSIIQWQVLQPLVNELISGIGTRDEAGSFFYVGDKKQAIYRFRGGEARLFDFAKNKFPGRIEEEYLIKNHRSNKTIIEFINNVFSNIKIPYPFIRQEAERDEPGYVELAAVSREGLGDFLIDRIKKIRSAGYRYQDIAILIRSQKAVSDFLPALKASSIPYRTEAKVKLLASDSVKACYNLLLFFDNPNEPIYLFNFLSSKVCREGISGVDSSRPILPQLRPDLREKIDRIWNRVDLVPICKIIKEIYESFNFFETYTDAENLIQFLDLAHQFEKENRRSLHAFLNYLDTQKEYLEQAPETLSDAVQVMTVHKAKGLEFEVVILPETTFSIKLDAKQRLIFKYDKDLQLEQIFLRPNKREILFSKRLKEAYEYEERRHIEDELNLLYVALTRAKKALLIIGRVGLKKDKVRLCPHSWFRLIIDALNIRPDLEKLKQRSSLTIKTYGVLPKFEPSSIPPSRPLNLYYPAMLKRSLFTLERRTNLEESGHSQVFGEAFHYAMAQIKAIDFGKKEEAIDFAISKARSKYATMLADRAFNDIKRRIENILNSNELRPYFSPGITVFNECPIFLKRENAFFRIDRLVLSDKKVVIIDYKTGFSPEYHHKYASQILAYKDTLKKIFPNKACLGLIIYALEDKVIIERPTAAGLKTVNR